MAPEFPLEHARMNFTWAYGVLFSIAMIAYGWGLHVTAPLPLILFLQAISKFIYNKKVRRFLIYLFFYSGKLFDGYS